MADNSLLAEIEASRDSIFKMTRHKGGVVTPRTIQQSGKLLTIMETVLTERSAEKARSKKWKNHRSLLCDCQWPLSTLLGSMTEENWTYCIQSAVEGMRKRIVNGQPNGDWHLADFEYVIEVKSDGEEYVLLGGRWVDALNEPDLKYRDGQPIPDIHVHTPGIPAEVIDALSSLKNNNNDSEMKDMIGTLTATLQQLVQLNVASQTTTSMDSTTE